MRTFIKYIIAFACITLTIQVFAQNTESGFFLEDYTYRFQMNPAFNNSKNFVAFPALGNINMGVNGTLGLSDVLYNVDGKTTTFLNPKLSADEVLKNIGEYNRLGVDFRTPIVAFGFNDFGGYNTVCLGTRIGTGVKIPGAVFSLLKEGIENKSYEIANLKGFANAYVELSLGHSRQISPELRIGTNLKILIGAANVNIDLKRANLTLGTDAWTITTDGIINANIKNFQYETKVNDYGRKYVSGVEDLKNVGIGGYGMGIDLGAVYAPKMLPDWEFSVAILDLGFITWNSNVVASTNGEQTFNSHKYVFNVDDDASNSFGNEWDKIKDDISTLYELHDLGDQGAQTRMLGATINLATKYTLPIYKDLNFGLLNTTHIQGPFSWTEFRLSSNITPCKVFNAGINVAAGTFGVGLGWMFNLHVTGFNFFLGMDHTIGKLAKQGVPLSSNADLNLGVNFLF